MKSVTLLMKIVSLLKEEIIKRILQDETISTTEYPYLVVGEYLFAVNLSFCQSVSYYYCMSMDAAKKAVYLFLYEKSPY